MSSNVKGQKRFVGLTVFLIIVAIFAFFAAAIGGVFIIWFRQSISKNFSLALIIAGACVFLTCFVLIIITRAAAKRMRFEPAEVPAQRYFAQGNGQVVYVTHDGILLTKVQYEALCLLMDECRSGRISKYEYCEAKKKILAMK